MHNEQDENLNNQIVEESLVAEEIQSAIELNEQDMIETSTSQTTNEELERHIAERLTEAVIVLGNNVTGLTGTLNAASQGIQEKSDKLQNRISESQARQQKGFILLTVVLAISTVIYTSMTWLSISAVREANEIQQKLLKVQEQNLHEVQQEQKLIKVQQEQRLLKVQREQRLLKVQQPSRPTINKPDPRNITRSAQKKRTVSPKR